MDVGKYNPLSFMSMPIRSIEDVKEIVSQDQTEVKKQVRMLEASYEGIDLRYSLKNLTHVGDLLLIAFAGTKGHKEANAELGMMMMDYHKLIVDAKLLCGKFVEGCVQSAIKHQYALENVANEKYDVALRSIESCSTIAKDLAVLSNKLACASTSLCDKAQIAFKKTSEAENITIAQRKQLQEDISKLTVQQEALKEQQAQLSILLEQQKKREERLQNSADKARSRSFSLAMVSVCVKPVLTLVGVAASVVSKGFSTKVNPAGQVLDELNTQLTQITQALEKEVQESLKLENQIKQKEILLGQESAKGDKADAKRVESLTKEIAELKATLVQRRQASAQMEEKLEKLSEKCDKQAEALEAQAQAAAVEVDKTFKERMVVKVDIKRAVETLTQQKAEDNCLETSIAALGLAVRTLFVVQDVLMQSYEYWTVVEWKCTLLSNNISSIKDIQSQEKEKLFDCICESGWSWLVLGKISHVAHQNLLQIRQNISKTFSQIPSSAEAKGLLEAKAEKILAQIKEEEERVVIIE